MSEINGLPWLDNNEIEIGWKLGTEGVDDVVVDPGDSSADLSKFDI